ncbi:MAG: hypothetical protein JSS32_05705 [Verrucomicrobia bacterium]|nr:hypothetical protein [Verrucomicrobiota bacterium]
MASPLKINLINSDPSKCFFANPNEVAREVGRLSWLSKVNGPLPTNGRAMALAKVEKVWVDVKKQIEELKPVAEIKDAINKGFRTMGPLKALFNDDLVAAATRDDIEKIAQKFMKAIPSLAANPVRKSNRGLMGPTLLVNYPRVSANQSEQHAQAIKWTEYAEYGTNQIYTAFAEIFRRVGIKHSCYHVPPSTGLDFVGKVQRAGSDKEFSLNGFEQVEEQLKGIAKSCDKDLDTAGLTHFVTMTQFVNGENMFDFIDSGKFAQMNEPQKINFFRQIGRLAMMDLLLGNGDRFFKLALDDGKWIFDRMADTNFGNAMVNWNPDTNKDENAAIFAIDNLVDPFLTHPEQGQENQKKYCDFIKGLLSNPDFVRVLSDEMFKMIQNALTSADSRGTEAQERQKEAFLKDLSGFGMREIGQGIAEMDTWLEKALIPEWEKEYQPLHKAIDASCSPLMKAVNGQIETYKTVRSK